MKPRWCLDRPDWREADRALLSGMLIYAVVVAIGYACDFAASVEYAKGVIILLFAFPYFALLALTLRVVKLSGATSLRSALAMYPLHFDRRTVAFAWGALAIFYGMIGLDALIGAADSSMLPDWSEQLGSIVLLTATLILPIAYEIFLRGYLYTRIAAHAGDLYALAVTGVFGGAIYYGAGFREVVQMMIYNLFLGWARARSGTVALPIFLNIFLVIQILLLSFVSVTLSSR